MVIVPSFFSGVDALRSTFDGAVDPDVITPKHYSWNYWNVDGQYNYLRTPARSFFARELFSAFEERLCSWGKATLGCNLVNSWWLSYYVNGCRQELHADVAHGPWAWVFSLTRWESRGFSGGETQIANVDLLDYWQSARFLRGEDLGAGSRRLLQEVPAEYGQLVVFDGRFPHGVREVRGSQDPRDSRVVLHGWFEPPTLQIEGALSMAEVVPVVRERHRLLAEKLSSLEDADGTVISRLNVGPSGEVTSIDTLTDTIESTSRAPEERERLIASIGTILGAARFPRASAPSTLIVPISAKRS
ncbi:MAG: hypothetical protein KF850_03960 [Labilithrix sp.]|nr:hypothetical protein [Labilithrix sp.]